MARDSKNVHAIKWIEFIGHTRPVVLQNENGPCPLLAIANGLLLLGKLILDRRYEFCANSWIIEQVAAYVKRNSAAAATAPENQANLEHLVRDVVALLPSLENGMDINARFSDCESFEFTPQLSVFDLVGLRLVHGFVVDPEEHAATSLRGLSYNQAMDRIVAADAAAGSSSVEREAAGPAAAAEPQFISTSGVSAAADAGVVASAAGLGPAVRASSFGVRVPATVPHAATREGNYATAASTEVERGSIAFGVISLPPVAESAPALDSAVPLVCASAEAVISSPPVSTCVTMAASTAAGALSGETSHAEEMRRQETAYVAATLRAWLTANSSQLTFAGLVQLSGRLVDREVAVFFRNNHFSTLFRHRGRLFLLLTDEGYCDLGGVVWECLEDIAGDTTLCTSNFEPAPLDSPTASIDAVAFLQHSPMGAAPAPAAASPVGDADARVRDAMHHDERVALEAALAASAAEYSAMTHSQAAGGTFASLERAPVAAPSANSNSKGSTPRAAAAAAAGAADQRTDGPPLGNRNDRYASQAATLRALAAQRDARRRGPAPPASGGGRTQTDAELAAALHRDELLLERHRGAHDSAAPPSSCAVM